ncbi:MAG: 3-isopropylmalate dehydratase small subunit [Burkholderiales bacterium]|nr:3-isopropylmalate dehydratase small subunit [Burkholderiales bacterium]
MEPFVTLTASAVAFDLPNIDTDRIVPARFLHHPRAVGFGQFLFHDLRFDADGREIPGFVLNQAHGRAARILVAADNFACGSSREAAVWALAGFGIRAVIAPSFGDIFFENSFKNGLLTIRLPAADAARLRAAVAAHPGAPVSVDLPAQTVHGPDGAAFRFEIDGFKKECLLSGQDEIGLTLARADDIAAFEARRRAETPWL